MFINDVEKMRDFAVIDKAELLGTYSYLTEKEYDDTVEAIDDIWVGVSEDVDANIFKKEDGLYCVLYRVVDGNVITGTAIKEYYIVKETT